MYDVSAASLHTIVGDGVTIWGGMVCIQGGGGAGSFSLADPQVLAEGIITPQQTCGRIAKLCNTIPGCRSLAVYWR